MAYPEKSYYDILGVPRNATDEQIRTAYREQIRFFHPDVFQGSPEIAKEKSQELNEAYSVLSDHEKRAAYDEWLKARDFQREQARQREEERRRQTEEQQRRAAEEKERQAQEEARRRAQQKAEEEAAWRAKQAQQEEEDCQAAEKKAAAATPTKKRISGGMLILSLLLAASVAFGVKTSNDLRAERDALQEELNTAEAFIVEIAEENVMTIDLLAFYKQAEEACDRLYSTYKDFAWSIGVYTTIEGADEMRASSREQMETALQQAEEYYSACEEWGIASGEDAMLMAELRRLTEKALSNMETLEMNDSQQYWYVIEQNSIEDSLDALVAKYEARGYYWELYNGFDE